jgi:uncharacterized protein (DUF2225 family)
MTNENPFFLSKIECPICKTINEYETVKVGSYFEDGRDTDFCPKNITWRYPRYQSYNPLAFFTAVCSNCFFSREFSKSYKEWKNDNNFRSYRLKTLKAKHLDRLAVSDSVIKSLGDTIELSRYPNESAIMKLHLTIFDELLCDRVNNLDLGRFYIRIGWIFRNLDKDDNPNVQFLKGLLMEIDKKYSEVKRSFENKKSVLETFSRHLSSHFDSKELSTDILAQIIPYREKFENEIKSLGEYIEQSDGKLENFDNLMNEYKSVALGGDESGNSAKFGQFATFLDFMLNIKERWSEAVTSENEAMEKAVYYYKEAFKTGREISQGNQQIQASYLIAELSRRIGDYDSAKQYFNSTIKTGQEFIYQNRNDKSRTALTRKILELAIEQGKLTMEALKSA